MDDFPISLAILLVTVITAVYITVGLIVVAVISASFH